MLTKVSPMERTNLVFSMGDFLENSRMIAELLDSMMLANGRLFLRLY
jgi:hypothetical protein